MHVFYAPHAVIGRRPRHGAVRATGRLVWVRGAAQVRLVRILVTGATGFVGWNVARDLASRGHEVIAAHHARAPEPSLAAAWWRFSLEAPALPPALDAVVHCAAIATVKGCGDDPARAERVNVEASRALAAECTARAIPLVLTSTDLVFDGARAPYREDDEARPTHVYGATKLRAERAVLEHDPRHVVLRLALVVGAHAGRPGGFLSWLVQGLSEGRPTPLYTNQVRTPLFVGDVAAVAEAACARRLAGGVYHLGSGPPRTREQIGRVVARVLALSDDAIVPTALPRPPDAPVDDCSLDTTKIERALGVRLTPLEDALVRTKTEL
jgi:dTDP-4-dehydrorhamnose reductase